MNTASSIFLAAIILSFLAYDAVAQDWSLSLFLARKFTDLLYWAAFWR